MVNLSLQLIENNKLTKSPVLDLGNCGIEKLPKQLFDCVWLEKLTLGNEYWSSKRGEWVVSKNGGPPNTISVIPNEIGKLKNLRILKIGGGDGRTNISNIRFLQELPDLLSLDLSHNPIRDVESLKYLTKLKVFNFSDTPYHQYSFLQEFEDLRCLTLRGNYISDIDFLEDLPNLRVLDLGNNRIGNISYVRGLLNLRYLNLGNNGVNRIHFLKKLERLEVLDLSYNLVKNAEVLEDLTNLIYLDLSENYLTETSYLSKLNALRYLDLDNNYITDFGFLRSLTALEKLDLGSNRIKDPSVVHELINLTELSMGDSGIDNIDFLKKLPRLESLDISNTRIKNIKPLKQLPALRKLFFMNAGLTSIRFIKYLPNLTDLDLAYNRISDISSLAHCKQLSYLNMEDNNISDLSALSELAQLTTLLLTENEIENIDELFVLTQLDASVNVDFAFNPVMKEIPAEVIEAGWAVIRDRLLALQHEQEFRVVKEIKLLLLGNTNVGKSNLLEYFETGNEPQLYRSTHGIQYRTIRTLINDVVINCWDFGGQEYFHATHQLFFSPGALNIILWSKENITREEGEECFDINYWLRCIEQLINNFYGREISGKSEVIISENKTDLKPGSQKFQPEQIDQMPYIKKFADLSLYFTHINLKPLKRMAGFKELLAEKIESLFINLQYSYHKYLDVIRQEKAPFMLIRDISPHNPATVQNAMKVFHNMGIILYFPEITPEKIFNKPQSLLDLLYEKILSRDRSHKITLTDIEAAIHKNPLALKLKEVIALLKHFDLVFQILGKTDVFFIPQYLPDPAATTQVFLDQLFVQKPTILIKSDHYLMNLAMLKIYSAYGRYVKDENPNEYLFWKDGIVIMKNQSNLMIKFDRKGQAINLFASKTGDNFHLQAEIVNFILDIRLESDKRKKGIVPPLRAAGKTDIDWKSELFDVYVSNDGDYFSHWPHLSRQAKLGINKIEAFTNDGSQSKLIPIREFNQFLPGAGLFMSKKVFISYSHHDVKLITELEKFLTNLKAEKLINVWHDGMIQPGDSWQEQISENIEKSNLFILLVSQDLIQSPYVNETELKLIFERLEEGDGKLVLVLLKTCDWRNWKHEGHSMSKFQLLPLHKKRPKPISEWANKEEAWLQVTDEIRRLILNDGNEHP